MRAPLVCTIFFAVPCNVARLLFVCRLTRASTAVPASYVVQRDFSLVPSTILI
jgi:hypothetical protein